MISAWLAVCLVLPSATPARVITIEEALAGVRQSNLNWQSLDEYLEQAEALKRIGIGMFIPKAQVEGSWVHQGEKPDLSKMFGGLLPSGSFDSFIPPQNTYAATFSVVVPILTPESIPLLRGALSQRDATIQRIGYGRDQLLFGAAKAYYGLLTLQSMIKVAEQSLVAAAQHFKSNEVKANLQAATQLEVKRAELEITKAESQIAELRATLEKTKAAFRYLTGVDGDFEVVDPALKLADDKLALDAWQKAALDERKDLTASRIEIEVADQEISKVVAKYFPSINFIAQGKADNMKAQRFDDDPYSWSVMGTLSLNVFDGGIREAQLAMVRSQYRQKELAEKDLAAKIKSDVEAAYQALDDARAASRLALRQLDVAHATQALAVASEGAGVATNLEIIDTNTMVFASEAQGLSARFKEAMAILDMLAATGKPVPFGGAATE
jgi:outer membrane protein TolC